MSFDERQSNHISPLDTLPAMPCAERRPECCPEEIDPSAIVALSAADPLNAKQRCPTASASQAEHDDAGRVRLAYCRALPQPADGPEGASCPSGRS
jgi:hypothetical protein